MPNSTSKFSAKRKQVRYLHIAGMGILAIVVISANYSTPHLISVFLSLYHFINWKLTNFEEKSRIHGTPGKFGIP